ncbi:MAG: carbohydrate ABC transporter permease [Burkholderiales bacterium]|nr:carbohydrate ABC transporter permease [Anaerolineae bacterium]
MFKSQRQTTLLLNTLSYIVIISTVIFAIAPIVWTLLTSVKREEDIVTRNLQYIPQIVTFDNYVNIWNRSGFPTLIVNSAITTAITLVICLIIGSLAGYAFSRFRFRGRTPLLLFYLVIRMFPVVLLIIPLFIILRDLGLLDTRHGLALAYTTFLLPLCVWMMKGFFDAIPIDLEEAARIDGCTRLGALFRIVLPIARSGFVATAVFIGIAAWNEYLFALMLTTGQGSRTWPVGIQLMVGEFQLAWGQFSAGGILSIIPIMIFFAIVQRSLVRGMSAGAIKG